MPAWKIIALVCGVIVSFATVVVMFPVLNPVNSWIIEAENENVLSIASINGVMDQRYQNEIYPQGKERIDEELGNISRIADPKAKLDAIFTWEMKDWINPNQNLSAFSCLGETCPYAVLNSDPERIKASPYYDGIQYPQKNAAGVYYADDPFWIAYNRLGECREYSGLFAFMAQESGIPARLVRTNSHQWVEVELNGTPYYYDPWCADTRGYYNAADGNMTFRDKWFNTIGSYEENCHPPDPYLISYKDFPYVWATPKYLGASILDSLGKKNTPKPVIASPTLPVKGETIGNLSLQPVVLK